MANPIISGEELQRIVKKMIDANDANASKMNAADWLFELGAYLIDKSPEKDQDEVRTDINLIMPEAV